MTPDQYEKREFQTSKISPFAANIAFEVFRPKPIGVSGKRRLAYNKEPLESQVEPDTPRGLVRMLVNEEPTLIPGCGPDYFCEWAVFKEVLRRAGVGCDFDGCCTSLDRPMDSEVVSKSLSKTMDLIQPAPVCLTVDPVVK
jgi:hypothetical protein